MYILYSPRCFVTDPTPRPFRRRSSASERAKEIEAINCIVSGKNVLITGGAAGLGYAFLGHFLKHGANVSLRIKKTAIYVEKRRDKILHVFSYIGIVIIFFF